MNQEFPGAGFYPADILLPRVPELTRWSVIACDQFTSQPEYWADVEKIAGGSPSALRLMLPEVYLGGPDEGRRIAAVNAAMDEYLQKGIFQKIEDSFIYVERTLPGGRVRRGLVGAVDLECYDYNRGAQTLIRATEGTVLERIPPRVKVRENAKLEMPHVMLLIDDPERTVIEPASDKKQNFEKLYDFELMKNGGRIAGYRITGKDLAGFAEALKALASQETFAARYGRKGPVMAYAAGDGNHSLATAKECWERKKKGLTEQEAERHPARFALVELVNIHDASLEFEPIHRVVFDVEPEKLLKELFSFYPGAVSGGGQGHRIVCCRGGAQDVITVNGSGHEVAVGMLQAFLDDYTARFGGRIDYIHGDDVVKTLSAKPGTVGFLLPAMKKSELFPAVLSDGALPRKTFSMGEPQEKRYYLECRYIG